MPYEFLSWRLGQTYYVKIADGQNEFDPNYSPRPSVPAGVPTTTRPSPRACASGPPRASRRLRPRVRRELQAGPDPELLAERGQRPLRPGGAPGRARTVAPRSREERVRRAEHLPQGRPLRGVRDRLDPRGSPTTTSGASSPAGHAKAQWNVQCCGFAVEYIQHTIEHPGGAPVAASVHLANIGDIANFLGNEDRGPRPGASRPTAEHAPRARRGRTNRFRTLAGLDSAPFTPKPIVVRRRSCLTLIRLSPTKKTGDPPEAALRRDATATGRRAGG